MKPPTDLTDLTSPKAAHGSCIIGDYRALPTVAPPPRLFQLYPPRGLHRHYFCPLRGDSSSRRRSRRNAAMPFEEEISKLVSTSWHCCQQHCRRSGLATSTSFPPPRFTRLFNGGQLRSPSTCRG